MRPRMIMVFAVAAILAGGVVLAPALYARLASNAAAATSGEQPLAAQAQLAAPPPTLATASVSVTMGQSDFFAWALLDRKTGTISGSANSAKATNSTESMIKIWIVSDYLRRTAEQGVQPPETRLAQASTAIRDSNDAAAQSLYNAAGGASVIKRMVAMCDLTNTRPVVPPGERVVWWAYTQMSAQDAVQLGECVKSGKAAGPKWTDWVLNEMTRIRGTTAEKDQLGTQGGGRWGIIDGLPKGILARGPVAIKNGWTPIAADGRWHVNCLAVTDDWVLAVQTRYPIELGLDHGASVCESVATQLVTPQPGAALKIPQPLLKG